MTQKRKPLRGDKPKTKLIQPLTILGLGVVVGVAIAHLPCHQIQEMCGQVASQVISDVIAQVIMKMLGLA